MGLVKQIAIINRTYYFNNDMDDIKKIDSNLLKIDKKSSKDNWKNIDDYENIYSVNPLHLTIAHASGYIEEKGVNKYYEKDYMNIKFNLDDDDLPLNKQLKFHNIVITITSVFEEDGKIYPQVFLDDTLYELNI